MCAECGPDVIYPASISMDSLTVTPLSDLKLLSPAAPFIGKRKAAVLFNPIASVYLFIVFCLGRVKAVFPFIFSTMKITY